MLIHTHHRTLNVSRAPEPIAIMIGQLSQGGSERQLYMFLSHCDQSRWSPVVYVSGELGFWMEPIRSLGIPVVLLHGSRLEKMRQFRAACLKQNAKCFFSWSSYTNGYGLALTGTGIRRIGSFRSSFLGDLPARQRWLWSWMSLSGITTAVCNSHETLAMLEGRRRSPKAAFVPNAVQVFPRNQLQTWRSQWRKALGLGDNDVLVVGVGRLHPDKNFSRFIDVIEKVREQVPIKAVIAGEDRGCLSELQARVERVRSPETVRIIGKVPDARELMCAADIFLLTSDQEGMPNVVLEAMAAGVPCVSTNVGAVGDVIEHGKTGYVAPTDANVLSKYVLFLAKDADARRSIGAEARAEIERFYHPEQVVRQLWAICE